MALVFGKSWWVSWKGSFVAYTSVDVPKHFLSVRMSTKGHFGYYFYKGSAGFLTVGHQLCKPKKLVNRKVTGVREINNKTKTKN